MAIFSKNIDMLNGTIWDKMVVFAIPLALTGVLQQLYNLADVAVLGHFVSNEAVAAVGTNVPIVGLIVASVSASPSVQTLWWPGTWVCVNTMTLPELCTRPSQRRSSSASSQWRSESFVHRF